MARMTIATITAAYKAQLEISANYAHQAKIDRQQIMKLKAKVTALGGLAEEPSPSTAPRKYGVDKSTIQAFFDAHPSLTTATPEQIKTFAAQQR